MTRRGAKPDVHYPHSTPADGVDSGRLIALLNEDLADSKTLHDLSLHLLIEQDPSALYGRIADAARQLLRSQFASLQMLSTDADGARRLDLIAHCGFSPAAAEYWRVVDMNSPTCCGSALATGHREVTPDVETSVSLANTPDLTVYRQLGIRAAQTTPLRSCDGAVIGMLSTHWAKPYEPTSRQLQLLDILARQAADLIERAMREARLRESEAKLRQMDRMKDQFLATLAHELRNPLAPIRSGLQILRLGQDPSGAPKVFEMLDRQLDHLVRLVDDLMEVGRINSGTIQLHRRRVELSAVLDAALELSRGAVELAGHRLMVRPAAGSIEVFGDDVRLAQVFSNLLNNAAKYTPPAGTIDVSISLDNGRAAIAIQDTGIGFSAEEQASLFTLFGRLQPQSESDGLGIGLALAKKLVELHEGTISARSDGKNKGSCFTVTLHGPCAGPCAGP